MTAVKELLDQVALIATMDERRGDGRSEKEGKGFRRWMKGDMA